jgi:hypothetical protein
VTGRAALDQGELQLPDDEELRQRGITALYGQNCPLATDSDEEEPDPSTSSPGCIRCGTATRPPPPSPVIIADRNRGFRKGIQWVTRESASGPYKEPPQPRDSVRPVANMIKPALQQRIQILVEQRPGYRVEASTWTRTPRSAPRPSNRRSSTSSASRRSASSCASRLLGADRRRRLPLQVLGSRRGALVRAYDPNGVKEKMGDIQNMVLRIEEVRVSANASLDAEALLLDRPEADGHGRGGPAPRRAVLDGNNDARRGRIPTPRSRRAASGMAR